MAAADLPDHRSWRRPPPPPSENLRAPRRRRRSGRSWRLAAWGPRSLAKPSWLITPITMVYGRIWQIYLYPDLLWFVDQLTTGGQHLVGFNGVPFLRAWPNTRWIHIKKLNVANTMPWNHLQNHKGFGRVYKPFLNDGVHYWGAHDDWTNKIGKEQKQWLLETNYGDLIHMF